ncbi:aldehyde dehydrogenase family protein [Paremcibacter congregatus]|uniref:Aldehyde dehydrogenase PuuC n=1 Tax=Paremcibacter congregatus TaxID=2043170 RepID=A0A2G4YT16_9PROT|nr:aldehyde dehydrogenase family protein [Paremcibacter congregatus]PHZ85478.1 aldehyde dehydrogenase PuuC [Paremcibacter congregatus]QDE28029.1 aldehyde dehydrogenase family protein [Paremcibacter congregatus]
MSIMQSLSHISDGKFFVSTSEAVFETVCPYTGKELLTIPKGNIEDTNRIVSSARAAYDGGCWSDAPPSFRKGVLYRFADLISAEAEKLDAYDAQEVGKPVSLQFCNAAGAANLVRFYAEALDKVTGDVFSSDNMSFATQVRVPRGVIGAIVPWNFPTYVAILKVAPALAAGNCVVLKPSELSSQSAIRLAQLALEAGLPPGVLNVVLGAGETVGKALGLHMDVDMLSFTGSTMVGKLMLSYAGQSNMKNVLTECGGKSPQIVFANCHDLDVVADTIAASILCNQGQVCSAGTRLLVERKVEEELLEKIVLRFKDIKPGNPLDSTTTYGPLVSGKQFSKVMEYIEVAASEGAELVTGGHRLLPEAGGYFVAPSIFKNVQYDARVAQEEIFGPVLSTIGFDDVDEAIRLANSTRYGIAAYAWTTDMSTSMKLARGVNSGIIVSSSSYEGEGAGHTASNEPYGQSGIGIEGGIAGMESYVRRKLVYFNHG